MSILDYVDTDLEIVEWGVKNGYGYFYPDGGTEDPKPVPPVAADFRRYLPPEGVKPPISMSKASPTAAPDSWRASSVSGEVMAP